MFNPHMKWWGRLLARRGEDPIPMALTAGGLVVSLIALPAGLRIDAEGFVNNVAAALVLIGPVFFSRT
ncbi:hypothetical protein GS584_06345 [Rhodococcus hoagii]|nr:hypothetical protein [Prescottella equi]